MKRLICLLCVIALALTLASCKKADGESTAATDTTETTVEEIELTDDIIADILSFRQEEKWDVTATSMRSIVDDGDEDTTQGSYIGFDGARIPGEKGNLYKGNTIAMNTAFSIPIEYELYYYDGWGYHIYRDATVEELNSYERYETTEEYFLSDFDGIVPTFASEEEMRMGTASKTEDGVIMVNVPLGEGRARDELLADVELIAGNNGVSVDDISVDAVAVSYAVKDGELVEFIGSYELSFYVESGAHRVFTFEKVVVINALGDDVETFTLPEDCDEYEIL
ncbi:MAG: hypothetical protein IJ519_04805 [Clostridia bacterium]|nr:hypothetical protein [Clostridia bacterium]